MVTVLLKSVNANLHKKAIDKDIQDNFYKLNFYYKCVRTNVWL